MKTNIFTISRDRTSNLIVSYYPDIIRINLDIEKLIDINYKSDMSDIRLFFSSKLIVINHSSISYIRKGRIRFEDEKFSFLNEERRYIIRFIENIIEDYSCIGSYADDIENKLIQCHLAQKLGIKVPCSSVKSNYNLTQTLHITKSIAPFRYVKNEVDHFLYPGTVQIRSGVSNSFPSLMQEYISKEFEVRSFYVNGKFFSMAIFSQSNSKTELDYRNYDKKEPNRNVPFQLPKDIEEKLHELMLRLDMNTGSIDLIYSIDKEFVFLEVNPAGQYGWLSTNCNYYIERYIANLLNDEAA